MKKLAFKCLMVYLFLISSVNAADISNIKFIDFVRFVSNTAKINIVLDEDIPKNFSIILPKDFSPTDSLKILKSVLYKNNMYMVKRGSIYYIKKYEDYKDFYSHKLNFLLPDKILPILKRYFSKVNFSKSKKTIIYFSSDKDRSKIEKLIRLLDKPTRSKQIRITLLSYKNSNLSEIGANLKLSGSGNNFSFDYGHILETLLSNASVAFTFNSYEISAFFSYLESKELIKYEFNPVVSLFDGMPTNFYLTKKIPFLNGTRDINGDNEIQDNSYDYKDVGSEIKIDKVSIVDDAAYFHINLKYEIILDSSETPVTAKREIDNFLKLKDGESVLIAGLKGSDLRTVDTGVPGLKDIPGIGALFSWKTKDYVDETFAILISSGQFKSEYSENPKRADASPLRGLREAEKSGGR